MAILLVKASESVSSREEISLYEAYNRSFSLSWSLNFGQMHSQQKILYFDPDGSGGLYTNRCQISGDQSSRVAACHAFVNVERVIGHHIWSDSYNGHQSFRVLRRLTKVSPFPRREFSWNPSIHLSYELPSWDSKSHQRNR